MLLHPLRSELNFPLGDQAKALDLSPLRWDLPIMLLDVIIEKAKEVAKELAAEVADGRPSQARVEVQMGDVLQFSSITEARKTADKVLFSRMVQGTDGALKLREGCLLLLVKSCAPSPPNHARVYLTLSDSDSARSLPSTVSDFARGGAGYVESLLEPLSLIVAVYLLEKLPSLLAGQANLVAQLQALKTVSRYLLMGPRADAADRAQRARSADEANVAEKAEEEASVARAAQDLCEGKEEKASRDRRLPALAACNLAGEWLRSFLPHVLSRVNRVHYGLILESDNAMALAATQAESRLYMAVPFIGKDVPSDAAEFAQPDVLIGFTILAYRYSGLRDANLREIVMALKEDFENDANPDRTKRTTFVNFEDWVNDAFKRLPSSSHYVCSEAVTRIDKLNLDDHEHYRNTFVPVMRDSPHLVRYFLTKVRAR